MAQGWFQVTRLPLIDGWRSRELTTRNKLGVFFLLGWREAYPWLSMQMFPLIGFLAWREGGVVNLDWMVPVLVLTMLFTLSVGPGQAVFAYRPGVPELRARGRWFVLYLVVCVRPLHRVQEHHLAGCAREGVHRRPPLGGDTPRRSCHGGGR